MTETILLKKATRVEGNADLNVEVENGRVKHARFMVHDFRGFLKFASGAAAEALPQMISRICGLCCVAHQVASFRAIEGALGVATPPDVERLRKVAILGEWIASHALSYFFLSIPDLADAPLGVFDLIKHHPAVAKEAFDLKRSGQRIVELLGKRAVHPVNFGIGKFLVAPTAEEIAEIGTLAASVEEVATRLVAEVGAREPQYDPIRFPPGRIFNYFAYDDRPDRQMFHAFDVAGSPVAEFPRPALEENVAEMRVDWSFAKFPYLKSLGFPDGVVLVGPLARAFLPGGFMDDPEVAGTALAARVRDPKSRCLDSFDACRLLEILWAARQILALLREVDLASLGAPEVDLEASGAGIGALEAPRGMLVHGYVVSKGKVERLRLHVATQFNNAAINLMLKHVAEGAVEADRISPAGEKRLARCVRTFDPCLSCATH